jgi:Peptidase S24-like
VRRPLSPALAFTPLCTDLLRAGWRVRFSAAGSSMAPTLRDGDVLLVDAVLPDSVRSGDVLLYASRRGVTAHRVVRLRDRSVFEVRGDAPGSPREWVPSAQVLGRVTALARNGRERPLGGAPIRYLQRLARAVRALRSALAPPSGRVRAVQPR